MKKNGMALADVVSLIVILVFGAVAGVFYSTPEKSYDDNVISLSDGWTSEGGTSYALNDLPDGDIVITHSLEGIGLSEKRLCFRSSDTHIAVSFDGEETYTYAPQISKLLGKSYGMYIHTVNIPRGAESVTLRLHPIYSGLPANISRCAVQDGVMFMGDVYRYGLPSFALCVLIALFGVLMLIMGFTNRHSGDTVLNFFSLGTFAILVGAWAANDTCILQVFTQHPETVRFVNYLCLIFIAYPPVSFIACATGNKGTVLLPVMLGLTTVNFVLTMILSLTGVADIRQMLTFSHVNIAIAIAMTLYLMITAARKKAADRRFLLLIINGMSAAMLGVGIDLVRFKLVPDSALGSSMFTKIGVVIFVVIVGVHLIKERTRLAIEQERAELMKKMAYTDGLTGLANRAAFHEREAELRSGNESCTVVQLDINFLKKVNDVYGHAEGDRHIINAARIISGSLGALGRCFRTGGDEFIAVAGTTDTAEVSRTLEKLERLSEEYNRTEAPPVPMRIACGYAVFVPGKDRLDDVEKLADDRMYERKRAMKQSEPA